MNGISMELSVKENKEKLRFKTQVRDDIIKDFFLTILHKNKFPKNETKMLLLLMNNYAVLHNNVIKLQGPFASLLKSKDGIIKIGKKKFKYKVYRSVLLDSVDESINKIKYQIMDEIGGKNCRFSIGTAYYVSSAAYLFENNKNIAEIYHEYRSDGIAIQIYVDPKTVENNKNKRISFTDFVNDTFNKFISNILDK
ncbi:MAG: hypothetical protein ABIM30_00060 [candidate division WOR-3 bacterium]